MPGVVIDIDTSQAITSMATLRDGLKKTGLAAQLTESQTKALEERFKNKLQADAAAREAAHLTRQIELIGKACGMSAKEVQALGKQIGVKAGHMKDAADKADLMRGRMVSLNNVLGSAAVKVAALATAYVGLREAVGAVQNFTELGLGFNKSMESAQLGIASVLAATQNISELDGRRLAGQDKLNAAQAISRDIMRDIQRMGLETTATTQQLVDGFQSLVGPATAAGLSLKQAEDVTIGIVQAFAALQIPMEQLSAEARSLFDGDIKMGQDRLAGVLGITKEMVLTWQQQGTYVENINKKLEFFKLAGAEAAKTWAGLASNTKEVVEVFAGGATQGLFTGAKQAMAEFTAFALDTKNAGLSTEMQAVSKGLNEIGDVLGKEVVSLTRSFIDNLKEASTSFDADETRRQIESIVKSAEDAGSMLLKAGQLAGGFLGTVLDGWNALPAVVQDLGIIGAVIGGAKARAAILLASSAIGIIRDLNAEAMKLPVGGSDKDTLSMLEAHRAGLLNNISDGSTLEGLDRVDAAIARIKAKIASGPESIVLNDSVFQPPVTANNFQVSPTANKTDKYVQENMKNAPYAAQYSKIYADRLLEREAAKQDWMKAAAGGDTKLMEQSVLALAIADRKAAEEHEKLNKSFDKTKGSGDTARKSFYEISEAMNSALGASEAMNSALGASEAWTGDAWSGKFRALLADLDKDLKAAKTPVEEYWARWEYGAKKAQTEFDKWTDTIRRSGSTMSEIGQLSFDPAKQFAGDKDKLTAEWLDAVKLAGGSQEEIARVNELYQLKEVELREKSLGDMAALDDGYWSRRKAGLDAQFEHLKAQGVNEHALAVHMAVERDKLNKEQLEKRLGYEDSFGGYLADRLALQYGLYKDAATQQLEIWEKTADATIELFDGVMDSFTWAMGQAFGDLLTGKFKDIETYTQELLAQLKNVFANWLTEMARIAANKYIVYPIMGQIVGTAGSFSAGSTGVSGLNTQGGDGASITDVTKYLGYGKDAYSMFSGGGAGAASLASEAAQGANFVGPSVQLANAGVPGSSSLTTLGALGAGAAAGGIGYMAGGFVRPDNPTASYVGAGAGLAAGTIAGMAGLGALAATGVGALVAIPAALAVGLTQGNTEKSEWTVPNASKSAIMIAGGENTNASYGVIKTTSSGAFGSSSTSHKSIFGLASPEMAAQQDAAWEAATAGLDGFTKAVGVSSDQLTNAKSSFNFPAIPIPDGMDAEVYKNVANAEAEHTLAQLGLLDAVKAVTNEGEYYIDTLNRLNSAMVSADAITQATGFDFSRLTAGMSEMQAADYVSDFADAAGGIQEVQTALGLLTAHTMDNASRTSAAIANMTGQADSHLVALGVSFEDFWGQMEAAFSGPLDPAIAATWKDAAKLVDQLDTLKKSMDAINSAARQFDASLSSRALSAQGFTYQASLVSMLASQEAELTQARIDGASAAQLARIAEVQALEQAALARQRAEQGDSLRSGLASRIATATGDDSYWMTEATANRQKDYFKIVWEYGYELADMSNRAYDVEIQARLASQGEAARLSREAFALDIQTRQLALAGREDEAGAMKLVADQAEQYRNAIASGLGAGDLDALLQVQRDELTDYWNKLVDDLKSAAAAIRDTVADLRAGDKSPLPVDQRYAMARAQFDAVVAKGMTGDRLAMSDAQSLAPSVLDALMATTTDRDVYAGGFGEVTGALSRLADVLVGENQKDSISKADASYKQALAQAATAFSASFQGNLVQQMATTAMGWSGGIDQLMASSYWPGGNLGWRADYSMMQGAANITDFAGWFRQNYGTGSGAVDWQGALEKWITVDAANPGLAKTALPQEVLSLYQSALAALDNLKAVRGFAVGGISSGPQLAMVSEGAYREEAHVPLPDGRSIPVTLRGGGGNGDLVSAIRELKAENAELRREQRQLLLKIESNTYDLSQRLGVRADRDGFPVRVVS